MEVAGGNISLLLAVAIVARVPLAGDLGTRPADEDHAGHRPALVRRPRRVAVAGDRPRGDGGDRRRLLRDAARRVATLVRGDLDNAGKGGTWASVPIPLLVRLPSAVALVVWGARTDRRWTVPVAVDARVAGALVRRDLDAARGHPAAGGTGGGRDQPRPDPQGDDHRADQEHRGTDQERTVEPARPRRQRPRSPGRRCRPRRAADRRG